MVCVIYIKKKLTDIFLAYIALSNQVATYTTLHPLWHQARKLHDSHWQCSPFHLPHWFRLGMTILRPRNLFTLAVCQRSPNHWYSSIHIHQWPARVYPVTSRWLGVSCLHHYSFSTWRLTLDHHFCFQRHPLEEKINHSRRVVQRLTCSLLQICWLCLFPWLRWEARLSIPSFHPLTVLRDRG